MANYKTEATAYELADKLARRTGLPAVWSYQVGIPTVSLGETSAPAGGGVTIQILDRNGEVDKNWDSLPNAGWASVQPVYNTGVVKVITESTVDVSAALAYATGVLTMTGGAAMAAGSVVIAGVTLTVGTHFAAGADDNASATNLAAAINAHPVLKQIVVATAQLLAASTVTLTARIAGAAGNLITTTEDSGNVAWGAGTLTGGSVHDQSMVTPWSVFSKVWAEVAKSGMKVEFWQTKQTVAPTAAATSYLQGEFFPNDFWPISGQA